MKFYIQIFFLIFTLPAHAAEYFEVHINARAMGMGSAFAPIVDTEESLWYNPAGIAKNSGLYLTVADPRVGISDPDSFTNLSDLGEAATFESTLNKLYGDPLWVGAGAKASIMVPYFAAGYFYDADTSIIIDNPVNPSMEVNFITDTGYALGTAWSIGGIFQMGFAAKYITRTGVRKTWGAQTIADIVSGAATPDVIFDEISGTTGTGYGLDMGINFTFPTIVQPTISFVWKDIGNTKFRSATGEPAPPTEPQDMTAGIGLMLDVPFLSIAPVLEVRHLNDTDAQITKKIHLGLELGLPLLSLRAGLYQGYYTAGVGLDLGLIQVDAATWGTEIGGYPGQLESRRYLVQATMRLGFDVGGGADGKGGKGGKGSGSAKKRAKKQRR